MMTAEARVLWHAERQTYIGASEAAEAVGLSRWSDPITLWERKCGLADERDESFQMKMGSLVEPIIGRLFTEQTGLALTRPRGALLVPPRPVRHPSYPFLGANPDFRIVGRRGLVQAKMSTGEEWDADDETGRGLSIPLDYRIQGFAELMVTGLDFIYFARLDPRKGLTIHLLDRASGDNESAIADLEADLVEFWMEYVETRRMPPPTALSGRALARRHPRHAAKIGRIASAGQEVVLQQLLDARSATAEAEVEEERLKNEIKAMIGEATFIEGAGHRFNWGPVAGRPQHKDIAKAYRNAVTALAKNDRVRPALARGLGLKRGATERDVREALDTLEGLYRGDPSTQFTISKIGG